MHHDSGRAYSVMVNDLRKQLDSGELRIGDRLPSEAELRDAYGISINSVRRGIEDFVERGVLIRRRGSGTYVQKIPDDMPPNVAPARRDTIGVYCDCWYASYHPYYTELHRGMRERLQFHGWQLDWPVTERRMQGWEKEDVIFDGPSAEQLALQIARRRNLAGAILTANYAHSFAERQGEFAFPFVATALQQDMPSVGYDWDEEMLAAIRLALRQGSRQPLVVTGNDDATIQRLAAVAARGEGVADFAPVPCRTPHGGMIYSRVVQDTFDITRTALKAHPACDGLVAGSDCHAHGAFDALADIESVRPMPIVTLTNRESRLPCRYPYVAFVADGRAVGHAAADLVHERIMSPETAPRRRILRCEIREIQRS